jgi:hypothetical protein
MTVTYDRFKSYIRCIKSVKPVLSEEVKLEVVIDSKLSWYKVILKYIITYLILFNKNFKIMIGGDCIGKSRHKMLINTNADYVMILDDDDYLNTEEFLKVPLDKLNLGLYNFDYYPSNYEGKELVEKVRCKFKDWFDNEDEGINVGTSTIFSVRNYVELKPNQQFILRYVDDMLPFHIMYLKSYYVGRINSNLVIRGRNDDSLMLSKNTLDKYVELVYSLDEFALELDKYDGQFSFNVWKVVVRNQLEYHKRKDINLYNLLKLSYGTKK